jgi:anti-sigma regulatory factor (Ser/Thr protein kinase)
VGHWRATVDVPATVHGPRTARRIVSALLAAWGLDELRFEAELLVSELVTNAFRHTPGTAKFELELEGHSAGLRIYLADGSAIRPVVRELREDDPDGRGMQIVQATAARWGADDHAGGKRVWVEIGK